MLKGQGKFLASIKRQDSERPEAVVDVGEANKRTNVKAQILQFLLISEVEITKGKLPNFMLFDFH